MSSATRTIQDVLGNVEIRFGLRAQGHFDTVALMRADGRSWEEIGSAIGWTPEAVEEFYELECDECGCRRHAVCPACLGIVGP